MNIVFMGTPIFSVPCLEALIAAGHAVKGVFTQPDKPRNRGKQITVTPVKECAEKHNIPVYQPLSLRKGDDAEQSLNTLKELNPDCIVVVAYGQFLPKTILDLPKYGCINVHASLLPKYRGAAPIQWCIADGEKQSGVTTMYMGEGLDTGDMIYKTVIEIGERMTGSELHDALSAAGAELIVKTLADLESGTAPSEVQGETTSRYASMISKEILKLDFTKPADELYNFIRAMSTSPCAFTFLDGKRMKVFMADFSDGVYTGETGTIVDEKRFAVMCGDGKALILSDIQPEGGKRMTAEEYLRGKKLTKGIKLG